jgi:hypothetical protein
VAAQSLRRRSEAAHLLGLRIRFPPAACMFVSCDRCVLSGRSLCEGADPSSREVLHRVCVCVCVCVCP